VIVLPVQVVLLAPLIVNRPGPVSVKFFALPVIAPLTVSVRPEATCHDCDDPSATKAATVKFVAAALVRSMPTLL
jgi:hypothetical protein